MSLTRLTPGKLAAYIAAHPDKVKGKLKAVSDKLEKLGKLPKTDKVK